MLVLCISTKLSGSMQSALSARELILEDYPDAKICVIDTTLCTVLQGLLVLEAAAMQERGAGFEETAERIEAIKSTGRIFSPWEIWNISRRADGSAVWPESRDPFWASVR